MLPRVNKGGEDLVLVGRELLLFIVGAKHNGTKTGEELTFVHFMEFAEVLHSTDSALESALLKCSTPDKIENSEIENGEDKVLEIGNLFHIYLFRSVAGRLHEVRQNYSMNRSFIADIRSTKRKMLINFLQISKRPFK